MVIGSLVKGLIPWRSVGAGFFTTRSLTRPGTTNSPGAPRPASCLRMMSDSVSKTRPTLFLSSSVASLISAMTWALVSLLTAMHYLLCDRNRCRPRGTLHEEHSVKDRVLETEPVHGGSGKNGAAEDRARGSDAPA